MHSHILPALLETGRQLKSGSSPSFTRAGLRLLSPVQVAQLCEQSRELRMLKLCGVPQPCLEAVGSSGMLDFPLLWGRNLVYSPTGHSALPAQRGWGCGVGMVLPWRLWHRCAGNHLSQPRGDQWHTQVLVSRVNLWWTKQETASEMLGAMCPEPPFLNWKFNNFFLKYFYCPAKNGA